jgi:hypothetical protein
MTSFCDGVTPTLSHDVTSQAHTSPAVSIGDESTSDSAPFCA